MPMRSLRSQLLLMTAIVLAIAAGVTALLYSRLTTVQFDHYLMTLDVNEASRAPIFSRELSAYYARNRGWKGIESELARVERETGRMAVLRDSTGSLHAAPPRPGQGQREFRDGPGGALVVKQRGRRGREVRLMTLVLHGTPVQTAGGASIGTLYMAHPRPEPEIRREGAAHLFGALHRGLAVALIVAGLLAALVALALMRRIVGPIETLTRAARLMERGDREARVPVASGDEIGQLMGAFNAMADSVARTERLRRDLVSDVAHELRTPLTNLRCQIEAIQDGLSPADAGTLASLHEEAMLLSRLVDDLQELALAESGGQRLRIESLAPGEELARAAAALAPRAEAVGITLGVRATVGLPRVTADAERLGQILRNLVDNALRHTPRGGRIELEATAREGAVEIAVRDTGPGIAAEHLPNVFERFYRTDVSRARATGGAGLGLAIVRQLVRSQGGEVRVESEPGRGAAFFFTLPSERAS